MAQERTILAHLKRGPISSKQASREYGFTRLAAIIFKIRKRGYSIDTHLLKSAQGGQYAVYSLNKDTPAQGELL